MIIDAKDTGHWDLSDIALFEAFNGFKKADPIGFLYRITDKTTGQYYIGIKQLFSTRKLPPLKGKKRKRIKIVESDWKTYCSSSGALGEEITANKDKYTFVIEGFYPTKTALKIAETKEIIENVFKKECANEMVNLRVRVPKSAKY